MVFSKKGFFEVKLIDENANEFKELYPKENGVKPYVVGEKDKAFYIKMMVVSNKCDDTEVYGCKLFIDGEEVQGIKTFKKNGRYFGFKMGQGVYKQFIFGTPCFDNEDKGGNKDIGKIKIVFYTTKPFKTGKPRQHNGTRPFKSQSAKYLDMNKKLCFKSLQVFEGNTFDNGHTTRQRLKEQRYRDQIIHVIDFQDDIDDIEFNYSDFYGLIALGMISTFKKEDLRYMPTRVLDIKACENALALLINELASKSDDKLANIGDLKSLFSSCCEHDLSLYYNNDTYGTFENLIKFAFNDMFEIVDNDKIKVKVNIDIGMKMRFDNKLLTSEYLLSGQEISILEKRGHERSSRKLINTDQSSMMIEPSDVVDLTDDNIVM